MALQGSTAFQKKITVITMTVVFLFSAALYVLSDAVLQNQSLAATQKGAHKEGNFSSLVNWLPKGAKEAIEYRARSVYLQDRMVQTRDPDMKAKAAYDFADYIAKRDAQGSDAVLVDIITNPETKNSRWAYPAYIRLFMNDKSSHPVSLQELHAYLASLEWPEDRFQAWNRLWGRMNELRLKPVVRLEVMAPLWEEKAPFRNFEGLFNNIAREAKNAQEPELEAKAKDRAAEFRTYPTLTTKLVQAGVDYRRNYKDYRNEIAKAKTVEAKIRTLTAFAVLTRDYDNAENEQLFDRLMTDPELQNNPYTFIPRSRLLLFRWNKKHQQSIQDYYAEIDKQTDKRLIFEAWSAGMEQLLGLKVAPKVMLDYLTPLLDRDTRYQEYAELFRELAKQARALGDTDKTARADAFLLLVEETVMPSLFDQTSAGSAALPAGAAVPAANGKEK